MEDYDISADRVLARVRDFYADLTPQSLTSLATIYAPDVVFVDPAGEVHGLAALQQHFANLLHRVKQCQFIFSQTILNDNDAVLLWQMTIAAAGLNGGRPYVVDGASHLVLARGRIIFHRDYFDLGALLYEKIPLVGSLTRTLRRRLANSA